MGKKAKKYKAKFRYWMDMTGKAQQERDDWQTRVRSAEGMLADKLRAFAGSDSYVIPTALMFPTFEEGAPFPSTPLLDFFTVVRGHWSDTHPGEQEPNLHEVMLWYHSQAVKDRG